MLMDIHVHGLCIYSQYQYYQIGFAAFALSLLVQESQKNISHFYNLSKSEFCSKIKIT